MVDALWILAAVAAVGLPAQIYVLGRKMSEPEKMIKPTTLSADQKSTLDHHASWLASMELGPCATFRFGALTVAVFQQKGHSRYLSFMFHQRTTWCAESYLQDLTILDTTNSGTPDLFPRPGGYKQNYPGASVDEIWRRHVEGERQLTERFGYQWAPIERPYEELLAGAMRVRMKHNREQAFWPYRVLFRYFTRKGARNRSIAGQYPATSK